MGCGQAPLLRVEDAFLRSVRPGRAGDSPLGLVLDRSGCYFDASQLSVNEKILRHDALDDPNLMHRSAQAITRMRDSHISKYNAFETTKPPPKPGYVLVIDQTFGDAAIRASGAGKADFRDMLAAARRDHSGTDIVIKSHTETISELSARVFQRGGSNQRNSIAHRTDITVASV